MMFILSLIVVAFRCVHGINYKDNVYYIPVGLGAIPVNVWYTSSGAVNVHGFIENIQIIYGRNNDNRNNWEAWFISRTPSGLKFVYMKLPSSGFLRFGQDARKEYWYCDAKV